MTDQDTSEIHEKTDLLCLMGHNSCLDAAIEKSKDSFEILTFSALIWALKHIDSTQSSQRKSGLKLATLTILTASKNKIFLIWPIELGDLCDHPDHGGSP